MLWWTYKILRIMYFKTKKFAVLCINMNVSDFISRKLEFFQCFAAVFLLLKVESRTLLWPKILSFSSCSKLCIMWLMRLLKLCFIWRRWLIASKLFECKFVQFVHNLVQICPAKCDFLNTTLFFSLTFVGFSLLL